MGIRTMPLSTMNAIKNDVLPQDASDLIEGELLQFPHIQERLKLFWAHKEFKEYISSLFLNTRTLPDGQVVERQGFPMPVFKALHKLDDLHDSLFPQYANSPLSLLD